MKSLNDTKQQVNNDEQIIVNTDAVKSWTVTEEGWLQIDIPVSTPGVLVYDKAKGDKFTAKEYRSADELFNPDSMNTLIGMPVTVSRHPASGKVTSSNYKAVTSGVVKAVFREGDTLVARVLVQDAGSINLIKQDKKLRGASLGYVCGNKKRVTGQTPWGPHDTVQEAISYNHLSIVRNPRNKSAVFNLDGDDKMPDEVNVDEVVAENTTLKASNDKLKKEVGELSNKLLKANNKIVNQDSERETEYQRGLNDGKTAHVLEVKAKELNINTDGMEPKTVKLAVIKKVHPDINTDGYTDEQVEVALQFAMQKKPEFKQSPRKTVNTDSEGTTSHADYQKRLLSGVKANAN
ncbi:TPA: DUF2213 domain-containing protein [Yersinia enterocolitica]|nr:DUF2213 domain-containing protein [Yersinia enterocolitica]